MGRTARLFIQNACNHIIARGIRKQPIFNNSDDYRHYLQLIHKNKIKTKCQIYGYCLMPNHIHLLLGSVKDLKAMSTFMHCVNQSYAMRFNYIYNEVGHLWQNRYKNFVIQEDGYLVNVISYVEFNPVRAGLVKRPEDWPWSSYRGRVLGKQDIIIDSITGGQI